MSDNFYGTLNDSEIINLLERGKLIIENGNRSNVKQACYELRAGNIYFDLSLGGEKHEVREGDVILFKPHQTIVIISMEKFELPGDILARFLSKGAMVSVGFTPINTYADPGFYGRMGIIMSNASNNYLKITSGDVIAKVEFDRLQQPVMNIYRGQHGFETGVWPIKNDYIVNENELKKYIPELNVISEIEFAYGERVADIMRRVMVTERRFLIATIFLIIINLFIIGISGGTNALGTIGNVICGIIANIVYAIISIVATKYEWRKKDK